MTLQPTALARSRLLPIAFVAACVTILYFGVQGESGYVDEEMHFTQMYQYLDEAVPRVQMSTMVPGFHWVAAKIMLALNLSSLDAARTVSMGLSWLVVIALLWTLNALGITAWGPRLLDCVFLPLFFPFFTLVYTDIFSLLFPVLALGFFARKNRSLCGLMCCFALFFRQSNVVWLVMLYGMIYVETNGSSVSWERLRQHVLDCWIFLLGALGFLVFVAWNEGIALGHWKTDHPVGGIYFSNIFFALQVFCFVFLPWVIWGFTKRLRSVWSKPQNRVYLVASLLLYMVFYEVLHRWNADPSFLLRNRVLALIFTNFATTLLAYIPVFFSVVYILSVEWPRASSRLLAPFATLSLLPIALVEPRYYLPIFVWFLLLGPAKSRRMEWALAGWLVVLSVALAVGHSTGAFFL